MTTKNKLKADKIDYLLAAIDTESFTAAADKFGLTPSGINKQISSLEEELGICLLNRSKKGVCPAKGTERIIQRLREIASARKKLMEDISEAKGLLCGELQIGCYYSIANHWLPEILKQFHLKHPNIKITLFEGSDKDLNQLMLEGKIDCVFLSQPVPGVDWYPITKTEMVALLPENHPLCKKKELRPQDFKNEPFVYPHAKSKSDIDFFLEKYHITPDISLFTHDPVTACAMVSAGLGVSTNNRLMVEGLQYPMQLRSFTPKHFIEIGVAVPDIASASPVMVKFLSMVLQKAKTENA